MALPGSQGPSSQAPWGQTKLNGAPAASSSWGEMPWPGSGQITEAPSPPFPTSPTIGPTSTGPTSTGPTSTGPTSTGPTSTGPTSNGHGPWRPAQPGARQIPTRAALVAVPGALGGIVLAGVGAAIGQSITGSSTSALVGPARGGRAVDGDAGHCRARVAPFRHQQLAARLRPGLYAQRPALGCLCGHNCVPRGRLGPRDLFGHQVLGQQRPESSPNKRATTSGSSLSRSLSRLEPRFSRSSSSVVSCGRRCKPASAVMAPSGFRPCSSGWRTRGRRGRPLGTYRWCWRCSQWGSSSGTRPC